MKSKLLTETKAFWKTIFPNYSTSSKDVIDFTERFPILKLAQQSRIFFAVVNFNDFGIEYFTKNSFDVLGIHPEQIEENGLNAIFEKIEPEHRKAFLTTNEHYKIYHNGILDKTEITSVITLRCGLKLSHSEKGAIRTLWRNQIFEIDAEYQYPQRSLMMIQDISHLIKNDFFWFRGASNKADNSYCLTSRSDTEGYSKKDILSDREKAILRCFAEGKGTEDVANELYISNITVKNHRQNMLNKLGARDVTALIQLAKLTKII